MGKPREHLKAIHLEKAKEEDTRVHLSQLRKPDDARAALVPLLLLTAVAVTGSPAPGRQSPSSVAALAWRPA